MKPCPRCGSRDPELLPLLWATAAVCTATLGVVVLALIKLA